MPKISGFVSARSRSSSRSRVLPSNTGYDDRTESVAKSRGGSVESWTKIALFRPRPPKYRSSHVHRNALMSKKGSKEGSPEGKEDGNQEVQYSRGVFMRSKLPTPILCILCASVTVEELKNPQGYDHLKDVRDLERSSLSCAICNMFKQAWFNETRLGTRIDGKEKEINSVEEALEALIPSLDKNGLSLLGQCPVILKSYTRDWWVSPLHMMLCAYERYGNNEQAMKGREMTGMAPYDPFRHRTRHIAIGELYLHGTPPEPLFPRKEEDNIFKWIMFQTRILENLYESNTRDKSTSKSTLPERVLDLGSKMDTQAHQQNFSEDLRLVDGGGRQDSYATLSYSWGSYRGFLTEKSSCNDRYDCIRYLDLPKVFQQAVFVVRKLGIRYLWVDALCIIQDDKGDWDKAVTQMGRIYRDCFIRLAVTAARDPTGSFYPPKPFLPSIKVENLGENALLTLPKSYKDDVDFAHLNTRAWVLQERLLSPKTIHFCKDHIYLETEDDLQGEDGQRQNDSWRSCIIKSGTATSRLMQRSLRGNYSLENDTSDSWLRIAERYSKCRLTYPTDKLVAIAALVQERQERGKFPYFQSKHYLGMWENTLHEDLLWRAGDPDGYMDNKMKYIADLNLPSWAWAAYEGSIAFLKDRRSLRDNSTMQTSPIKEFELIKLTGPYQTVQLPSHEPISMVVRLRCARIPKVGSIKPLRYDKALQTSPFRYDPTLHNRPVLLSSLADYIELLDDDTDIVGHLNLDIANDLPPTEELWCAHIATLHNETYDGPDPLNRLSYALNVDEVSITIFPQNRASEDTENTPILAYCLILKSMGTQEGTYRRVGIAEMRYEWMAQFPSTLVILL